MAAVTRFLVPVLLLIPAATYAQHAPAFLEPGHWTWEAVRRLTVAGLAPPAAHPAVVPVSVSHARRVFAHAASAADSTGRDDFASLARAYAQRLNEEADSAGIVAGIRLGAGWMHSRGESLAGEGYFVGIDFTGARELSPVNAPAAVLSAHGFAGELVAWSVTGGYLAEDWVLPTATVALAAGPFDVWAGRRRLHFGVAHAGGIVLGAGTDAASLFAHRTLDTFEGGGIHVREPFHLPWILRVLGPARFELDIGRITRSGAVQSPWVAFGRFSTSPFGDRLTLVVNRGAIFGGDDNPVTLRRLLGLVAGLNEGIFENQVYSLGLRYRPPVGELPLEAFVEFGADDSAGALDDVPTYMAGIDIAALPGLTAVSFGIEHTRFSGSCCGNPQWYRNVFSRGSWTDEGRLFAHPLGGHGYEWRARVDVDLPSTGMFMSVDGFRRRRGHENLFAPERQGYSFGAAMNFELRRGRTGVSLSGDTEWGASWDAHRISAMVSRVLY